MELRDPHLLMLLAPELAGHYSNTIRGTVDSAQLLFPGQRLGGTREEGSKASGTDSQRQQEDNMSLQGTADVNAGIRTS